MARAGTVTIFDASLKRQSDKALKLRITVLLYCCIADQRFRISRENGNDVKCITELPKRLFTVMTYDCITALLYGGSPIPCFAQER